MCSARLERVVRSPLRHLFSAWGPAALPHDPAHRRLSKILYPYSLLVFVQWAASYLSPLAIPRQPLFFAVFNFLVPVMAVVLLRRGLGKVALDLHLSAFCLLFVVFFVQGHTDFMLLLPSGLSHVLLAYLGRGIPAAIFMGVFFGSLLFAQRMPGLLEAPSLAYLATESTTYWVLGLQMLETLLLIYLFLAYGPTAPTGRRPGEAARSTRWVAAMPAMVQAIIRPVQQVLCPPVFQDSTLTWQAARLHPLLLVNVFEILLAIVAGYFFSTTYHYDLLFNLTLFGIGCLLLILVYVGRIRLSAVCISLVWGGTCGVVGFSFGGLHPATLAVWFASTLGFITIHTFSQGVILGGMLLVFNVGIFWGQLHGFLPPMLQAQQVHLLITAGSALLTTLVILRTVVTTMQQALVEGQSSVVNYQQVLALSPVGILVMNEAQEVTTANAAAYRVCGLAPTPQQVTHPFMDQALSGLAGLVAHLETCKVQGTSSRFETSLASATYEGLVHLEVHCARLQDGGGQPLGYQIILVDTTELTHKEAQLHAHMAAREQLSQNLHDGILQTLYAHGLRLEDMLLALVVDPDKVRVSMEKSLLEVDQVMQDVRRFIAGMTTSLTEPAGLPSSLTEFSRLLMEVGDIQITVDCPLRLVRHLTGGQAEHCVHIGREALSNAVRHGKAEAASVRLKEVEEGLLFEVADTGRGFEGSSSVRSPAPSALTGHGLANMRMRAAQMGAQLRVESQQGTGTTVRLWLQVSRKNHLGFLEKLEVNACDDGREALPLSEGMAYPKA